MKSKIIAAIIYATASFSIFGFFDAVYGAGPVTRGLVLIRFGFVGLCLFVAASIFSLIIFRAGIYLGFLGAIFLAPYFGTQIANIPWRSVFSILPYANWLDELVAILTLIIATLYSVKELYRFIRNRSAVSDYAKAKLILAALYGISIVCITIWPSFENWLFRLHYGN